MNKILFPLVAERINAMHKADQDMRRSNVSNPDVWDEGLDYRNTEVLKLNVVFIGWFAASKVGLRASRNAALIVRHADHDIAFQRHCLELMKACANGDADLVEIAYLEDRICVNLGGLQIYGTQFHEVGGVDVPRPIWNPRWVDHRRKKMGLSTLAEGIAAMRLKYAGKWKKR
ncbi:MAG: DUF6624 domain-containing protein [Patescibacteria group bacterium]